MTIKTLMTILYILVIILTIGAFIVIAIYIHTKVKDKKENNSKKEMKNNNTVIKKEKTKQYTIGSVFDFMEFEKIEDNMIVQKNGNKYIMIINCQGINYDLMSEPEKISVEEGFIQFLNTLSGQVQLYTQTRTINLEGSIQNYKNRVDEIENTYNKQKIKYEQLTKSNNISGEQLKKEYYELIKQRNLCEYGKDIIYNTEKMSLNKNILSKKYYVAISYYTSELGQNNFDKDEIKEMAFSELYTRAQSLIRALNTSGVVGKIMSSTDLLDLLYVAYNRDDAEIYGIDKAMKARYDELYSTAPDYMDKKIKLLDEEINKKAYQKANEKVIEVQSDKQKIYKEKRNNIDEIINNLATLIIEENANNIGRETADMAKEKLTKENKRKENGNGNVQTRQERSRNVTNATK